MAQSPAPGGEPRPPNVSKSWLDLKWKNPENTNRLASTSRIANCRRCKRSCKRSADCSLCTRLGKVSKVYPKLSVKTVAKPSELDEVAASEEGSRQYRQYWWRCNGPCRDKMPYLGVIRRSTSRPPGPTDKWWSEHVKTCGGTFVKVRNPQVPKAKNLNNSKNGDIRDFLSITRCSGTSDSSAVSSDVSRSTIEDTDRDEEFDATWLEMAVGAEAKLQSDRSTEEDGINNSMLELCDGIERKLPGDDRGEEDKDTLFESEDEELNDTLLKTCEAIEAKLQGGRCSNEELVPCLACGVKFVKTQLDSHLVACMNDIFEVEVEDGAKQFSCPLCLESVGESDLKEHIDGCSSTADSAILFRDE